MRSVIKIILATSLLAVTDCTGYAKPVTGIIVSISETSDRHLSGFTAVNVAGPFDVVLTQGSAESVKVEAPGDVMDRILTEVNNGVLKIYSKHDSFNWGNWWGHHNKVVVYVTAKNLNAISLTGSGDVRIENGFTADAMKLRLSGSGDLHGKIDAKTVETSLSGSGDVSLSGHAENSTVSITGSGDYSAGGFTTVNTAIRISGSGDARLNVSGKLEASVNGSGDISYSGHPKNVSKSKSGSGDIDGD